MREKVPNLPATRDALVAVIYARTQRYDREGWCRYVERRASFPRAVMEA